jgi:trk system potassium uptake protein TrkA
MKKQIVVIGLGQFGTSLATTLACLGHDVLALDRNEKEVQNVASQVTHAVQVDATNETLLKELGVGNFDIAIVGIGSRIESSVLATILVKKLGVPYVIARADSELHGSILEKIGADRVV